MGKIVTYIIWKKIPYGHSPRTQVLPFSLATFPPPPSIPRRNLLPSHHGVSGQLRAQVEAGEHARAAARPHCRHWDTSLHCRAATDAPGHPPSIPRAADTKTPPSIAAPSRHLPPTPAPPPTPPRICPPFLEPPPPLQVHHPCPFGPGGRSLSLEIPIGKHCSLSVLV
jgi:hypothetical protein